MRISPRFLVRTNQILHEILNMSHLDEQQRMTTVSCLPLISLPIELLRTILGFTDRLSLMTLSIVSKQFFSIVSDVNRTTFTKETFRHFWRKQGKTTEVITFDGEEVTNFQLSENGLMAIGIEKQDNTHWVYYGDECDLRRKQLLVNKLYGFNGHLLCYFLNKHQVEVFDIVHSTVVTTINVEKVSKRYDVFHLGMNKDHIIVNELFYG